MIAPNKQNLLLLAKQLKSLGSGQKLLEEKRNGLIANFLTMARKGKEMELAMSHNLSHLLGRYDRSLSTVSSTGVYDLITQYPATHITTRKKRVSGVVVTDLQLALNLQPQTNLRHDISQSINSFGHFVPTMLQVFQLRNTCQTLAREILKTNRQINAIEIRVEQTAIEYKSVRQALEERSNFEKSVLITIFNT